MILRIGHQIAVLVARRLLAQRPPALEADQLPGAIAQQGDVAESICLAMIWFAAIVRSALTIPCTVAEQASALGPPHAASSVWKRRLASSGVKPSVSRNALLQQSSPLRGSPIA
jgi:hypothetical protein